MSLNWTIKFKPMKSLYAVHQNNACLRTLSIWLKLIGSWTDTQMYSTYNKSIYLLAVDRQHFDLLHWFPMSNCWDVGQVDQLQPTTLQRDHQWQVMRIPTKSIWNLEVFYPCTNQYHCRWKYDGHDMFWQTLNQMQVKNQLTTTIRVPTCDK